MKPEDLLELPEGLPPRLREYVAPFQSPRGHVALQWIVGALAFLSFMAFLAAGADTPADPMLGAPSTTTTLPPPKPSRIGGFNEVFFKVTQFPGLPGAARNFCGLHAATPEQQARGLSGRSDLAGYDAMLFTFGDDASRPFTMKNTKIPLTVAFFDAQGRFLGSVEMTPCPVRIRRCPEYRSPGEQKWRFAMEVQQGGLNRLGIGPGATVTAGGGCI